MLTPQAIADVDAASALGIATLWNDAIPAIHHMLDHQVADIDDGIRWALECDSDDCQNHDVRHRDGDDECPCWGCTNSGLLVMARDTLYWLDDLAAGGTAYGRPSGPERLLSLITDWLHINDRAPRVQVPNYQLGPAYRLLAELADQTNAKYDVPIAEGEG